MAKCKDCALFTADEVNPEGGLGDCPEENEVNRSELKNGEYRYWFEKKLTYPGIEACGKFRQTPKSDSNA